MSGKLNNLFFSPEVASSIGLDEAIILNLIKITPSNLSREELNLNLDFLSKDRKDKALTRLLALELIFEKDSNFSLKKDFLSNSDSKLFVPDQKLSISKDIVNQAKSLGIPEDFIKSKYKIFIDSVENSSDSLFKTDFKFLKYLIKEWRMEEKKEKSEAEKIYIKNDWSPSGDVISILESAEMDANFIKKCIPEFIVYWKEKRLKSNEWNTIFINHVRRQWARYKNIIEDNISPKKMTNEWMPNQNCFDVLKLAKIDENFAKDQLPEFKIYWIDSNQVITSWNSKFIQHVKYKWFKNNSKSSGIISRLTDKEWAIEY